MDMQTLQDLEDIRQLKSRYFRLMDTQQWEAWKSCFTEDISAFYEGGYDQRIARLCFAKKDETLLAALDRLARL